MKLTFQREAFGEPIKIKCKHRKMITISIELNGSYWEDGAHIEMTGCDKCAEENNMEIVT